MPAGIASTGVSAFAPAPSTSRCGRRRSSQAGSHQLPLPATAREQIAVGLAVIDAIELQLAPVDRELCS